MNKLRLLVTKKCNRCCEGCCNKQWDLDKLPLATHLDNYFADIIMLTGGEPLLFPDKLEQLCCFIRQGTKAKIYIYTAKTNDVGAIIDLLPLVDGFTITLHEQKDVNSFVQLYNCLESMPTLMSYKSMRLNVFKGITMPDIKGWQIKDNIEWINPCPLPENEDFRRLENLW
jgi:hypothetical protein